MEKLPKSYLAGWITAIILAFGPLFIDSHRDQYLIFLPGLLSIIIPVIIDQWNSWEQRSKMAAQMMTEFNSAREEIFSECRRAIPDAQVVTKFSLRDAHLHVAANAVLAKKIFNTRLGDSGSESKSAPYMALRDLQDDGFIAAIQKGHEYNLLYDITHQASVDRFSKRAEASLLGAEHSGFVNTDAVDARGMPLLQFIVLEYEGYKECLVGYGMGGEIASTPDIYLIRSGPLCDYLRHVHTCYRALLPKAP